MIRFQIGHNFYEATANPGWGEILWALNAYDQATGAAYAEVALTGLSKNVALIGTATAWGAIGKALSGYAESGIVIGSAEVFHTAAYDDTSYLKIEQQIVYTPAGQLAAWVYAEVALTGLSKNIALNSTGAEWGAYQPLKAIVLRVSPARAFAVVGAIAAIFTMPPPQGFLVQGNLGAAFVKLAGTVQIRGAFECVGEIDATFTPVTNNSFAVQGTLTATFSQRNGQQATCISAPDTPPAGAPNNAAF